MTNKILLKSFSRTQSLTHTYQFMSSLCVPTTASKSRTAFSEFLKALRTRESHLSTLIDAVPQLFNKVSPQRQENRENCPIFVQNHSRSFWHRSKKAINGATPNLSSKCLHRKIENQITRWKSHLELCGKCFIDFRCSRRNW